ncbi:MAG: hypothetical protein KAU21_12790, partial [Gammaproteobacteria bacterium]|nr:hypothetical protein [Gammaproteobacteria bacterium]
NTGILSVYVSDNEVRVQADNLNNKIKSIITDNPDFGITQNYVEEFINTMQILGTDVSTKNVVHKVLAEKKVITLDRPEVQATNYYNFVTMNWPVVSGATIYEIYDGLTKILTTTATYADVSRRFDTNPLNLSVIASNEYEVSPEAFISFSERGETNDVLPRAMNTTASKDKENQIEVCFDYPVFDRLEYINSAFYVYHFTLFTKDNNLNYRPLTRVELPSLDEIDNNSDRFNRYCFNSIDAVSTDIVPFKIESTGFKYYPSTSPRIYTMLNTTSTESSAVYGYTVNNTQNTILDLKVFGSDDSVSLRWNAIKDARKYIVYLADNEDFSNAKVLVEAYTNQIEFALPYVYLKDRYYLKVEAVTATQNYLSEQKEYTDFNNRRSLICGATFVDGIPYLTLASYQNDISNPAVNQSIYYKYAINNEIVEDEKNATSGFNNIQLKEDEIVDFHFSGIDYSQSIR